MVTGFNGAAPCAAPSLWEALRGGADGGRDVHLRDENLEVLAQPLGDHLVDQSPVPVEGRSGAAYRKLRVRDACARVLTDSGLSRLREASRTQPAQIDGLFVERLDDEARATFGTLLERLGGDRADCDPAG